MKITKNSLLQIIDSVDSIEFNPEKLKQWHYRLGTVNSKSFVSKILLQIKWKFELTVHFKHEMLEKYFTVTSN